MSDFDDDVAFAEAWANSPDTAIDGITWQHDGYIDDFGFQHLSNEVYGGARDAYDAVIDEDPSQVSQWQASTPHQHSPEINGPSRLPQQHHGAFNNAEVLSAPLPPPAAASVTVHRPVASRPGNFRPAAEHKLQHHVQQPASQSTFGRPTYVSQQETQPKIPYDAFGRPRPVVQPQVDRSVPTTAARVSQPAHYPKNFSQAPQQPQWRAEQSDVENEVAQDFGRSNLYCRCEAWLTVQTGRVEVSRGTHESQALAQAVQRGQPSSKVALIPVSVLPDIYRKLWRFGVFNAVQTICFDTIFRSDINVVVSAPTGAGKTVLFELAVLRLFSNTLEPDAKVVYMAPTKSLCSERANDWRDKFQRLGLGWTVTELTGDTATGPDVWKSVKKAKLIITTPEKFDSVTRKWHDHDATLAHLRLLCVDECHSVGMDVRGATLEVVVSRMKTLGTRTRIVAVSATIPNIEDLAEWLGAGPDSTEPAKVFGFGDEFRPCPLKKIVIGYPAGKDDWQFNASLNFKLFDLIRQHSSGKPVLVFCNTRKGCVAAAETIAKEFQAALDANNGRLPWPKPSSTSSVSTSEKKLATLLEAGVAFHHAGMDLADRRLVEQRFAASEISIVCATSTLSVGVNLPARMVIIKGTKTYRNNAMEELTDMEILQMIGRAGRPQFDTTGVAVIMTEMANKSHLDALVNARTNLESCLHKNLIEHINSEVTLNTIYSVESALLWLRSTFLSVRIKKDPAYYSLSKTDGSPGSRLDAICIDAINDLAKHGIIEQGEHHIAATAYGQMMARTFLSKATFVSIKELPPKSGMRALLETVSNASEFREIRFRAGEKSVLAKVNKDLKFPVAKMSTSADKTMVLIQVVLQGIPGTDLKTDSVNPMLDANLIWPHVIRLVKCIVDILLDRKDGGVRTAIELMRSVHTKAWDNSPFVLRLLAGIGEKSVKALSDRGISTFEALRTAEPHTIEMALNRNPPYGRKLIAQANAIPAFEIKLETIEQEVVPDVGVLVTLKIKVKIVDTKPPCMTKKGQSPLFAMVLVVTSDYEMIEFRRVRMDSFLSSGEKSFNISTTLVRPSQRVFGCISCDQIAGSETRAEFKPVVPASVFPVPEPIAANPSNGEDDATNDDWDDEAEQAMQEVEVKASRPKQASAPARKIASQKADSFKLQAMTVQEPRRRPDLKFDCNHVCKDKTSCRHLCCQQGLDKPPPVRKPRKDAKDKHKLSPSQPKLSAVVAKKAKVMQSLEDMSKSAILPPRQPVTRLPAQRPSTSGSVKLASYGNRTIDELFLDSDDDEAINVKTQEPDEEEVDELVEDDEPVAPRMSTPQQVLKERKQMSSSNESTSTSSVDLHKENAADDSSLPELNTAVVKQFLPSSSPDKVAHDGGGGQAGSSGVKRRPNVKRQAVIISSDEDQAKESGPLIKLRKFLHKPVELEPSASFANTSSTVKSACGDGVVDQSKDSSNVELEIDELESDSPFDELAFSNALADDVNCTKILPADAGSNQAEGSLAMNPTDSLPLKDVHVGAQTNSDDEFEEWLNTCTVVI
ncbi:hypothetical protein ACM66B_005190 [Microbotryomycetes sp. NB124-2]